MEILKNISVYIILGFITTGICLWLNSSFLSIFLHSQIITLSITLVAITSTLRGLILGKITDLSKEFEDLNFSQTFRELKTSLYEQIVMVFIALFLLILYGSDKFKTNQNECFVFVIDSLLSAILFYNIYILSDSGKAIIDIYITINERNKRK